MSERNIDKPVFPEHIAQGYREMAARMRSPEFAGQLPSAPRKREYRLAPEDRKLRLQHVYIFRAGDYVKVGIAHDVMARWRAIAQCNPLMDEQMFFTPWTHRLAFAIERRTHEELAQYRASNTNSREWFKCELSVAIEPLERVIAKFGEA